MQQAIWQGDELKDLRDQICGGLIKHGGMKLSQYGVAICHSFAGCEAFPLGIPYPGAFCLVQVLASLWFLFSCNIISVIHI